MKSIFAQDYRGSKGKDAIVGTTRFPYYIIGWSAKDGFESGDILFCEYVGRVFLGFPSIEHIFGIVKSKRFNLQFSLNEKLVVLKGVNLEYEIVSMNVREEGLMGATCKVVIK